MIRNMSGYNQTSMKYVGEQNFSRTAADVLMQFLQFNVYHPGSVKIQIGDTMSKNNAEVTIKVYQFH